MTKPSGKSGVAIPVALLVTGLIGLGIHQQKIKHNAIQIEKKVDITVYKTDKESDKREHDRMLEQLDTIQTDVKELLKK